MDLFEFVLQLVVVIPCIEVSLLLTEVHLLLSLLNLSYKTHKLIHLAV